MIKELLLLDTASTDPFTNLAVEEYLTKNVPADACVLYLWQNRHTVVIGRNQNVHKECNVEAARKDGIFLVRRLSGGGAVYHDMGNLNFTFIANESDYSVAKQTRVVLRALEDLGVTAEATGRNDIVAYGAKISGNAFYKTRGQCCHHGTLLINADKDSIARYLNVSGEKLALKGVDSVKARVGNLADHRADISVDTLKAALAEAFGEVYGLPVKRLKEEDLRGDVIDGYRRRFSSDEWLYGSKRLYERSMGRRFDWGDVEVLFNVREGRMADVCVYSDAMEHGYIERLAGGLDGCEYSLKGIYAAIDGVTASGDDVTDMPVSEMSRDIKGLFEDAGIR